jgi:hypothetical protein
MQPNTNQEIQALKEQMTKLQNDFNQLSGSFYKNNFPSHQDFNKSSTFSTKLKVPSYTVLPSCQTGEILESGGKLYICSATDTWTIVGTQS